MNPLALLVGGVSLIGTVASGQQTFSHNFDSVTVPWASPWEVYHSDPGAGSQIDDRSLLMDGNRFSGTLFMPAGVVNQSTGVHMGSSFDDQSSFTIGGTWYSKGGLFYAGEFGVNEMFRIGVIGGSGQFVGGGFDSFYLSALEVDAVKGTSNRTQLQLGFRDESGAEILAIDTLWFDQQNIPGTLGGARGDHFVYDITQTYTPTAVAGFFDIDINIDKWRVADDGVQFHDTYLGNFASYSLNDVDSGLTGETLARFYPAIGYSVVDPQSVSSSGANFDGTAVIPEPSGAVLAICAAMVFVGRRSRGR